MRRKFLTYDWFKLFVLLLLIVLLFVLSFCVIKPKYHRGESPPHKNEDLDRKEKKGSSDRSSDSKQSKPEEGKSVGETGDTENNVDIEESTANNKEESQTGTENGSEEEALEDSDLCPNALPVRITSSEIIASVVNADIPLRGSPEVAANIILLMPVGTEVKIISEGPVCTDHLTGANNWWEVQTSDGFTGYAAEGSAINPIYYLEAVKEP